MRRGRREHGSASCGGGPEPWTVGALGFSVTAPFAAASASAAGSATAATSVLSSSASRLDCAVLGGTVRCDARACRLAAATASTRATARALLRGRDAVGTGLAGLDLRVRTSSSLRRRRRRCRRRRPRPIRRRPAQVVRLGDDCLVTVFAVRRGRRLALGGSARRLLGLALERDRPLAARRRRRRSSQTPGPRARARS